MSMIVEIQYVQYWTWDHKPIAVYFENGLKAFIEKEEVLDFFVKNVISKGNKQGIRYEITTSQQGVDVYLDSIAFTKKEDNNFVL